METTHKEKQNRAIRMNDMADQLVDKITEQIRAEGVLQWPEIATVLAVACAKSVVSAHQLDRDLGSEMAQTAMRVLIKNLMANHVRIPDLEMDGWAPPNVQWGNDSQH